MEFFTYAWFVDFGASLSSGLTWAFVLAGFVVGLVVGLTGVGGGSLMTPILIFFFGIKPSLAVGTDLLFAAGTKGVGALKMALKNQIPWRVVGSLSLGSLPAALVTIYALKHWGAETTAIQTLMTRTLGVALLLTALAMFYKAFRSKIRGSTDKTSASSNVIAQHSDQPRHWALPVLLGAVIGVMVALTSVGAGAIGVSALLLLYPHLPLPRIIAADIAYAVPLTLVAGLGHAAGLGSVDWALLAKLLAGSLPGIWLGTHLSQRASTPAQSAQRDRALRTLLAVLLGWASMKLLSL